MPVGAAIIGSGLINAGAQAWGASQARSAVNNAADKSNDMAFKMFNILRSTAEPFIDRGQAAVKTLSDLVTPGANMTSTLSMIPGFQFMSDWGKKQLLNQGATRGWGGNVATALDQFGTNYALQQGWQPIVQSLQGVVNSGVGALGTLGSSSNNTANLMGGNYAAMGSAGAGASMSTAGAIGNAANSFGNYALLNSLTGGKIFGGGASGGMYGQPSVANGGAPAGYDANGNYFAQG